MHSSQITKNHTILARYRLLPTKTNNAVIDRNNNGKIDLGPTARNHLNTNGTAKIEEPILDLDLRVLRDHAELNGSGSVYTEDCLGTQSHYTGRWNGSTGKMMGPYKAGDLTDLSRSLNPFVNVDPQTITWAIESGNRSDPQPYLYIIADKDGACG
jgi:hypothetical protein